MLSIGVPIHSKKFHQEIGNEFLERQKKAKIWENPEVLRQLLISVQANYN